MGGDGNTAGDVLVDQNGGIMTQGAGSNGILAQSIGGGGGNGGGANSLSMQLATSCTFGLLSKVITGCQNPKNASVNVQVDVGGFGGIGNNAGTVTVLNHDFITTTGNSASGIVAQSLGGGGGNGGQAIVGLSGAFPGAEFVDYATSVVSLAAGTTGFAQGLGRVTVGGFGGSSGDGQAVTVTNHGVIQTSGISAHGIDAQSIGGGGGIGGDAASGLTGAVSVGGFGGASGNGGDVTVANTPSQTSAASILTIGYGSTAILAQSVGGGGGNGGSSGGLLSLGGFGGASGNGGEVTVTNDAALQTDGDQASAIIAQSIGGGGGNGGGTGLSVISVGGYGGSNGDGGNVSVTDSPTATILTLGEGSGGVFAQSVGGGGGNGDSDNDGDGGGTGYGVITVGGNGSGGGLGGMVTIANDAMVETHGDNAIGLFGQSIGGSGGSGGATTISAVSVGGSGGSSGDGGEVDITNTAQLRTLGVGSDAIRAQSVGGGGGSASGTSGSITTGLGLLVSVGG